MSVLVWKKRFEKKIPLKNHCSDYECDCFGSLWRLTRGRRTCSHCGETGFFAFGGRSMGGRNGALRVRSVRLLMSVAVTALGLVAFLLVGPPTSAVAQPIALPGKSSVDANGNASDRIAISVPPGTAGLAPTLSFQYNNLSGNGLLGMGWPLGVPAVGRCPQRVAQDGAMGRINSDANDRFCLDGQRLMALNGGTYGADGTRYAREIESLSLVISRGMAGKSHRAEDDAAGIVCNWSA
jgi:Salmonella virulence plasmid 65kDa B protein